MKSLSLQEIASAVGGKLIAAANVERGEPRIGVVSTDSRAVPADAMFVALRGDKMDGHRFLPQVADRGAAAAIVEVPSADVALPQIVVADARRALGALAAHVRAGFERCRVVGIAGSNGKTSTKHLVAAALGATLRGTASPKSFNNDIGVPLTIFPVDDAADDYVVLELGTNHPGEIATLAAIARPDVCIITNCTAEHLEGLGDLDGVRRENASVVDGMTERGTLILFGDDPAIAAATARFRGRVVTFGFGAGNDLVATDVRLGERETRFALGAGGPEVVVPMLGRHSASNALAAIAVARALDVPDADSIAAIATSTAPEMRMQRVDAGGVAILNDCYNANPASMRAAIETLVTFKPKSGGRRVAMLGEMREMGAASEALHRELGASIAATGDAIAALACVGPAARWIADAALANGYRGSVDCFEESATAAIGLESTVGAGDVVLVKGSRGVRMERVVERLVTARSTAAPV